MTADPTWIAYLTPPGRGALATLGLCGPLAWEAARPLFRTRGGAELPALPRAGTFRLGRLGAEVTDEVVLAVQRNEPTPWLEIHCHGGPEVVRLLLDLFAARGLQVCSWAEFLRHTDDDPWRAAAAIALAHAPTVRTAGILLDQHHGAFAAALAGIRAALDRDDAADAVAGLDAVARFASVGRHLTTPWRVTVAGAPNVGKSSLVNALAGYARSVVAPTPGTTRDVVTTALAIDGWPVELADTAGLRDGDEPLEQAGIARARAAADSADLCLWMLDGAAAPVWPDASMAAVRLVLNKVDLPPSWDHNEAVAAVRVSAQTGEGVADLCATLSQWLVPNPPPTGSAVPFAATLSDGIERIRQLLLEERLEEARKLFSALSPQVFSFPSSAWERGDAS